MFVICEIVFDGRMLATNSFCRDVDLPTAINRLDICISKLKALKEGWQNVLAQEKSYSEFKPAITSTPSQSLTLQKCESQLMSICDSSSVIEKMSSDVTNVSETN